MTADELAAALTTEAAKELANALSRIEHCLNQLTTEQVWARPQPTLNSIGNLVLHLCGNLRQWMVAGLSGETDTRNRSAEFAEQGPIPREELLRALKAVVDEAQAVLARQTAGQLVQLRRVQGWDVTGLAVIFDSVPHFRGHTQEIIHMTCAQLGEAYQYAWRPTTTAQGAG